MGNDIVETIPKKDAVNEVRKACDQFADLYFHTAKVLYDRYGEEEAKVLLTEIVAARAAERGKKLASKAEDLGLCCNKENFVQVTDIPFLGWDPAYGKYICPFADNWSKRIFTNNKKMKWRDMRWNCQK